MSLIKSTPSTDLYLRNLMLAINLSVSIVFIYKESSMVFLLFTFLAFINNCVTSNNKATIDK